MEHLYGEFPRNQIAGAKKALRGEIFLLLLCGDPETAADYDYIDLHVFFESLMYRISGMNTLLMEPPELVKVMSLLQAAKDELNKDDFDFKRYRKAVLDAGTLVSKLRED